MYEPVKVEPLSKAQISRLLNGHSVRVKHHPAGKHTLHLHKEQMKKLGKAHAKGGAINLTFDPYQIEGHQHLRGECEGGSLFGSLKKVASSSLGKAVQGAVLNKGLQLAGSTGYLSPAQLAMASSMGKNAIAGQGFNFGKALGAVKGAVKSKLGKQIQGQILNTGLQLAQSRGLISPQQAQMASSMGHKGIAGEGFNFGKALKTVKGAVTSKLGKQIQGQLLNTALQAGQSYGLVNPQQAQMASQFGHKAIGGEGLFQSIHKAKAHLRKTGHQIQKGVKHATHQVEHGFKHAGHQIQHGAEHLGHQIQHGAEHLGHQIEDTYHDVTGMGFHSIKMKPRRGRKPKGGALFTAGGALYNAGEY